MGLQVAVKGGSGCASNLQSWFPSFSPQFFSAALFTTRSFAQEKGGEDETGPYDVVAGFPATNRPEGIRLGFPGADSHLEVDIEVAKAQSSENPVYYVQYANARINSIFEKAKQESTGGGFPAGRNGAIPGCI